MTAEKPASKKGELRRRHRELLKSGRVASLGSEGRLMLCYALHFADFEKCTVKLSARGSAKFMGANPTTAIRGLRQLVRASVLSLVSEAKDGKMAVYELCSPTNGGAHTVCPGRAHSVSGARTPRVQSAHEVCALRAHSVSSARTQCAHITSIPIGNHFPNGGINDSPEPEPAGQEPAGRAGKQEDTAEDRSGAS
jgi:hypothetical protein